MFAERIWTPALAVVVAFALIGCCGGGDGSGGAPVDLDGNIISIFGGIASSTTGGGPSTEMSALFLRGAGAVHFPAPGRCTTSTSRAIASGQSFDPGTLTITGAEEPITFGGTGISRFFRDPERAAWQPGAFLTLKSTGGADAPAFEVSVVSPDPLAVSSPDGSTALDVARDRDFVVAWDPLSTGGVALSIDGPPPKGASFGPNLFCVFTGNSGQGTVPAALFRDFVPGDGALFAESFNIVTARAGVWKIVFGVEQSPAPAAGGDIHLRFR